MVKSKRQKRTTSSSKLDKHLYRYAAVCTIVLGIVGIASFVAINLTTVDNPITPTLTGDARIYANGQSYKPAEFEGATVSGTIIFYFDVLTGAPDSVWFEVWTAGLTGASEARETKIKTGNLVQNAADPQSWQGSFDTTTIPNGEYYFDVKADPGDGNTITLSTFSFLKTDDGGEGLEPPDGEFEIPIEFVLIVLGIIGFAVAIIVFVIYRWR